MGIDVPQPLTNDLLVFLCQTIDAEYVKWASQAGKDMYVKAFIVNVNKCLKPFLYPATKVWRGIMLYPSVSVRPSVRTISDR